MNADLCYDDAAKYLGISRRSLERLKAAGKIGFNDVFGNGARITFSLHHLDDYRRRSEHKAKRAA